VENPDETFYRTYWGGSAMGAYYLLKHTPAFADPLGPDDTLCLMLSAATGVAVSGNSRCTATAKSPLTGLIGDSQAGGFWPAELKFAGFDGIVITGKSPQPVYLWIHDGQAELRDAGHLWGRLTGDVESAIKRELGDEKIEVAQIGPSGERLVRFAAIMNMSNRAHGRTGMGAVMGSKNLKAIAVRGHGKVEVHDKAGVARLARSGPKVLPDRPDMQALQDYGTAGCLNYQNEVADLAMDDFIAEAFLILKKTARHSDSEGIVLKAVELILKTRGKLTDVQRVEATVEDKRSNDEIKTQIDELSKRLLGDTDEE
jgi:aldehyde:ferredoxin oxidoreductase